MVFGIRYKQRIKSLKMAKDRKQGIWYSFRLLLQYNEYDWINVCGPNGMDQDKGQSKKESSAMRKRQPTNRDFKSKKIKMGGIANATQKGLLVESF